MGLWECSAGGERLMHRFKVTFDIAGDGEDGGPSVFWAESEGKPTIRTELSKDAETAFAAWLLFFTVEHDLDNSRNFVPVSDGEAS